MSAELLKAKRRLRDAAMKYAEVVCSPASTTREQFANADDALLRAAREYGRIIELVEGTHAK